MARRHGATLVIDERRLRRLAAGALMLRARGRYRRPSGVAGRKNMLQLIQLRWLAVVGQVVTILARAFRAGHAAAAGARCSTVLALPGRCSTWPAMLRCRAWPPVSNAELFVALLVDVAVLTAQLYLSGGATNPFIFLYLLQVVLGAVLLRAWSHVWAMVGGHRPVLRRPDAVRTARWPCRGSTRRACRPTTSSGLLLCFLLDAALLVVFIGRISRNLRQRDAQLAHLRQRAAEEEHIVRMGLLASGAAHELGTPLATLSVILGDWRAHAAVRGRPGTAARRSSEMQAPDRALQVHRQRHPAVGRRGARRGRRRKPRCTPSWTSWWTTGAARAA